MDGTEIESYCPLKKGTCYNFRSWKTSCVVVDRTKRDGSEHIIPRCRHYRGNIPKEGVWL